MSDFDDESADRKAAPNAKIEIGGKNEAAMALGRLGGLKGGKARAERLSAEERSRIARVAAAARWKKEEQ